MRRSKKTPKLRVTGFCANKGPVTRKMFPFDDVVSIWQRHREWSFFPFSILRRWEYVMIFLLVTIICFALCSILLNALDARKVRHKHFIIRTLLRWEYPQQRSMVALKCGQHMKETLTKCYHIYTARKSSNAFELWPCGDPPTPHAIYAPHSSHMVSTFSWNCETTLLKYAFYVTFCEKFEHKPSKMRTDMFWSCDK